MGKLWSNSEIRELPAYKLQKRIPQTVEYLFFFGAGASYGSDESRLAKQGRLPPLGRDLFQTLNADSELKSWNKLPQSIVKIFHSSTFEEAMDFLDDSEDWANESFKRELDLARFFSRFHPQPSNLYWKLAKAVSRRLKGPDWSGAAITLNYERLLEESFIRNRVFTVVKGVTFFDDNLPPLDNNQLFEVCYPHGACQFFLGQNWFQGAGNIVFGKEARMRQEAGVNHILKSDNIPEACDQRQIPMICRYQSSKRASVKNYFIDTQQKRCTELIINAKTVTIIGVLCAHKTDRHLWKSLERTSAFLTYVAPGEDSQERFRIWAKANGKIEGVHFQIIPKTYKEAFSIIKEVNGLQ